MKKISMLFALLAITGSMLACPFTFINDGKHDVIIYDIRDNKETRVMAGGHADITGIAAEQNLWLYVQDERRPHVFINRYGIDETYCVEGEVPVLSLSKLEELAKSKKDYKGFGVLPYNVAYFPHIKAIIVKS